MALDLLAASRRPLQRLLHECSFSEWENIGLFLDDGTTEAVRWAGGLGFVLEELGISQVLDLQVGARLLVHLSHAVMCEFIRCQPVHVASTWRNRGIAVGMLPADAEARRSSINDSCDQDVAANGVRCR